MSTESNNQQATPKIIRVRKCGECPYCVLPEMVCMEEVDDYVDLDALHPDCRLDDDETAHERWMSDTLHRRVIEPAREAYCKATGFEGIPDTGEVVRWLIEQAALIAEGKQEREGEG